MSEPTLKEELEQLEFSLTALVQSVKMQLQSTDDETEEAVIVSSLGYAIAAMELAANIVGGLASKLDAD